MAKFLTKLKDLYISMRGFHTNRKLVVIESDDWGSIRMPSKSVFNSLKEQGDCPEKDAFLSFDRLESQADLDNLYNVLNSVKDKNGNPAVITANFATANPDFEQIRKTGTYSFKPFYQTYKEYYPSENVLEKVKQGISLGVFYPQLHCREHVCLNRWLSDIKSGKKDVNIALENNMIGIGTSFSIDNQFGYMDAFNSDYASEKEISEIVKDATQIFYNAFNYKSKTFVASCFVWDSLLEKALLKNEIFGLQSASWQNKPNLRNGSPYNRKIKYTGEKNNLGQVYTVRNCAFEPCLSGDVNYSLNQCYSQIKNAFKHKKPAIINSHRVNYMGGISAKSAENNLLGLKNLLEKIVSEYKDVEFITSAQLLDIIKGV